MKALRNALIFAIVPTMFLLSTSLAAPPKRVTLVTITVTPASASVPVGLTQQFSALGIYSDQSTKDLTGTVSWSTSNSAVANISSAGLATANSVGTVSVRAKSGSVSGSASLQVLAPVLKSIAVTPASASVPAGQSQQFTATGTLSDGSTSNITNSVAWTSSAPAVAAVSAAGLALGVATGNTTITATSGSITGSAALSVSSPALISIAVTPANPSVPLGQSVQFTATGTYSDGGTQNLSATATWSSSATGVATVSSSGLATSRAAGSATITATFGGISGQTTLTVSPAALVSLSITPTTASIPLGAGQQFAASGTFTDGSVQNVTNTSTWVSSAPQVATINSSGFATSIGTGSSSILASSGSISSNNASLTVLPAALQSITLTPANPSIALGTTQQFTATGTYSDGSTQDLTSTATWRSSATSVATISSAGLAASVNTGATTISATSGAITGLTTLTVSPAQLVSIAITPAIPSIPLGTTQQFAATGTFTDRTTQDLTATVHWSSSNASVATISNSSGTYGLATSLATGSTNITASSGSVSGSTALTVTPAILISIDVTPSNASIALGSTQQYTATGTYSDSSTQILTSTVTWNSSATSVATIDNTGMAQTVAPGSTSISASFGGITGSTNLTVTSTVLVSIAVSPSAPSIPLGTTQQFTARGTYNDGSTQDLSTTVRWTSSDGTVATVSNSGGTIGLATSLAVGYTTITATLGTVSGTSTLSITPAQLVSMTVSPTNPTIALGQSQQFSTTGTYTDRTTKDLTTNATWTSSSATVAVISNSTGSQGLATSSGVGSTTITATMGSISASTTLTVGAAQLVSIAVTPANASIALGTGQQYTATGTYTNSTTADLTSVASWSSSLTTVATIASTGSATSTGQGTTTITATYHSISGTASLTVTAPVVVSLKITPANPSIFLGATQQFTATATYSNSSTANVTASSSWTSSSPAVATINSSGLATGLAVGSTGIAATYSGHSDSTTLSVLNSSGPAASPVFSPNSGSGASINVAISTATTACNSSAYLRYTLDGTTPTIGSTAGTSVLLNQSGTYTIKAGVFSCPGYADSAISTSGTYTITLANIFSSGFEADNLTADGFSSCGLAGCTQESSTYVTPPNPGTLSLGNYSRQFVEPTLYRYNVIMHDMTPTITSGTLYTRFYMYLGANCSGSAFWLAALVSDDPTYDASIYIMSRPDNQLEIDVITSTTAYVHTTITGGLAMAHWYRVEFSAPVSTSPTATVEMKVYDGNSTTPLPGGDVILNNMTTVYKGGTGHKEIDIGASNVQTLCSANSPATVTLDNVGMGTAGWIGPATP